MHVIRERFEKMPRVQPCNNSMLYHCYDFFGEIEWLVDKSHRRYLHGCIGWTAMFTL